MRTPSGYAFTFGRVRVLTCNVRRDRRRWGMASGDPLLPLPDEPVCGIYRHYKGNLYEVKGVVRHSESLEPMVLYTPIGERGSDAAKAYWVRPQAMWSEMVELESGIKVPRFSLLESKKGGHG